MKLRYKINGLPAGLPAGSEHQVKVTDVVAEGDTITVIGEYVLQAPINTIPCARTACGVPLDANLGGGVHMDIGLRYCYPCGRKINEAAGRRLVVFPTMGTDRPNMSQMPREDDEP